MFVGLITLVDVEPAAGEDCVAEEVSVAAGVAVFPDDLHAVAPSTATVQQAIAIACRARDRMDFLLREKQQWIGFHQHYPMCPRRANRKQASYAVHPGCRQARSVGGSSMIHAKLCSATVQIE